MNPIVFAIVVLVVLGLAGGVILVLASKFMAVYEDPRIAQITECLAGANCGGCGYAGCADYAKAIVENGAPTFKCAPGGDKTADAINTIMGNDTDDRPSLRATVICAAAGISPGLRIAPELTLTLSAPHLSTRSKSSSVLMPPPTVSGMKIWLATCRRMSVKRPRPSTLAVIS